MTKPSRTARMDIVTRLNHYGQLLTEHEQEIARLRQKLGSDPQPGDERATQSTTRRGMLKVAGAGILGAAGAALLGSREAFATQGSAVIAGQANTETATTVVDASAGVNVDGRGGKVVAPAMGSRH